MTKAISRRGLAAGLASGLALVALRPQATLASGDFFARPPQSRISLRVPGAPSAVEINRLVFHSDTAPIGLELGFPVPDFPADAGFGSGRGSGLDAIFQAPVAQEFAGALPAGHVVLLGRILVVALRDEVPAGAIRRAVITHQRMSWQPEDHPLPMRVVLPSRAEIDRMPRVGAAYLAHNGRLLVVVRPSIVAEPL